MAECVGKDYAKPMTMQQEKQQKLTYGNNARQAAVVGVLGSAGAQDAIGGYRDNDVTTGLVNGKHNNPRAMVDQTVASRAVKNSSKVAWTQPAQTINPDGTVAKGRKLTLQ